MTYCCYCFLWFSLILFNNEEYTLLLVRSMRYLQVDGGKDENFERKINLLCSKHGAVLVKPSKKYSIVTIFLCPRLHVIRCKLL